MRSVLSRSDAPQSKNKEEGAPFRPLPPRVACMIPPVLALSMAVVRTETRAHHKNSPAPFILPAKDTQLPHNSNPAQPYLTITPPSNDRLEQREGRLRRGGDW